MKKTLNKIISIIINILIVIVTVFIIIGIYYLIQVNLFNKGYANIFGYTFFEVATGSMSNTIEIGDVLIVKITKEVEENDIIVYSEDENFITHRLIKKDKDNLIAKGDANNSEDKPININQVLGKVEKIIPRIGIIRQAILSKEVLGLILIVILLLFIIYFYTNKSEEKDEKQK